MQPVGSFAISKPIAASTAKTQISVYRSFSWRLAIIIRGQDKIHGMAQRRREKSLLGTILNLIYLIFLCPTIALFHILVAMLFTRYAKALS